MDLSASTMITLFTTLCNICGENGVDNGKYVNKKLFPICRKKLSRVVDNNQ